MTSSRAAKTVVLFGLLGGAVASVACKPKKVVEDAGVEDAAPVAVLEAPPAAAPPVEPEAKNADQLTRFPTETRINNEPAKLEKSATSVRVDPPNGKVFAVLPKGTDVVKVAQNGNFILVNFASLQNPAERLSGWISKESLVASAATTAKPVVAPPKTCPAGQTMLWGEPPFCEEVCNAGSECKNGELCLGVAPIFGANKLPGKAVKFCVGSNPSAAKDAGAADPVAVLDAGAAALSDAGTAVTLGGRLGKLGGLAGAAATGTIFEQARGGKCRDGRLLIEELCRVPCASDSDCAKLGAAVCLPRAGTKVCAPPTPK